MPGIVTPITTEAQVPITKGPGFIGKVFFERTGDGPVSVGVVKTEGEAYAWTELTPEQWWQISRALFPGGDPGDRASDRADLG